MQRTEFKVGDVVRLKSGGLNMTIIWVDTREGGGVMCGWFTPENKYESAPIQSDALILAFPNGEPNVPA